MTHPIFIDSLAKLQLFGAISISAGEAPRRFRETWVVLISVTRKFG